DAEPTFGDKERRVREGRGISFGFPFSSQARSEAAHSRYIGPRNGPRGVWRKRKRGHPELTLCGRRKTFEMRQSYLNGGFRGLATPLDLAYQHCTLDHCDAVVSH